MNEMSSATVPCRFCSTLNRIDLHRIADRPKCGRCARPILLDRPVRLTDANFDRIVQDASVPLLVDFYADWCMPCKIMAPVLDEVAHEHRGRVLIGKLDTETNPRTASRFGIRNIPTVIVFENGSVMERQSGALRQDQIESLLKLKADR